MEKEFVLVRSMRDMIISSVVTVAGVLLVVIPVSVSLNILGVCLAVPGLLLLLFYKSDHKDVATGEKYHKTIKYYPVSRKQELLSALESGTPAKTDWKESSSSDGLMLEVLEGRDNGNVFVRLSEFIPYNYEPCGGWFQFDRQQAAAMLKK